MSSPDETISIIETLFKVVLSRPTLNRYRSQGLISEPKTGAYGRGGGRWTDYPQEAIAEAYVAWKFFHGQYGTDQDKELFGGKMPLLTPQAIKCIRDSYWDIDVFQQTLCGEGATRENVTKWENSVKEFAIKSPLMQGFKILWYKEFKNAMQVLKTAK